MSRLPYKINKTRISKDLLDRGKVVSKEQLYKDLAIQQIQEFTIDELSTIFKFKQRKTNYEDGWEYGDEYITFTCETKQDITEEMWVKTSLPPMGLITPQLVEGDKIISWFNKLAFWRTEDKLETKGYDK